MDLIEHATQPPLRACAHLAAGRPGDLGQSLHHASRPAVRHDQGARPAPRHHARRRLDARTGGLGRRCRGPSMSGWRRACARLSPRSTARWRPSTPSSFRCRWRGTWWPSSRAASPTSRCGASVVPSLTFSNIAREVLMDAGIDATVPAFSTVMACSTSMMGAIEAAGMIDGDSYNLALVGGVDSLSRIQIGLGQRLSDWLRKFQQARSLGQKIDQVTHVAAEATSGCSSRRSSTARPGSAWASIPRSPPRTGRSAARSRTRSRCQPPARGGRLGQRLLRRPRDPDGRRQARHHSAQGHLAGEARTPAADVRPHQRQGHA